MAKRSVTITLKLDPTDYGEAVDTPEGAIDVVIDCLRNQADFATTMSVECEGVTKSVEID